MDWQRVPLGQLQTNAYILKDDEGKCVIFDPGAEGERLVAMIKKRHLTPLAILLTHAHFDHIGAITDLKKHWDIDVYLHENEKDWLSNPILNGSQFFMSAEIKASPADKLIKRQQDLTIGDFHFELYETPGHSPGSVSYYNEELDVVFCGDTLFRGSIGRTDLPGGNHSLLLNSIEKHILSLPEDTIVLPGHGPETTVDEEMATNPFLNGFS
ncbi:MBL fold metallo-hydrolase [Bacillus carboniphilus]|uniref:MBL fold metallo-hydrolase n=1 Tax=Bacillus carboniphilus TaxID=86663 RepID=A0ABY9JX08_9BACI|nr:MBL fold metallo-hydrolase [Bacillus carboniphilus]WLR43926.1 MBL fold metallo-hydrolase [Bacillus carboniphilus]